MTSRSYLVAICIALVLLVTVEVDAQRPAGTRPSNLRVEYLLEPMSIDTVEPRLSWIIESGVRGRKQTAYQIIVSGSPANLTAGKGDLWDTGKVVSSNTIQIAYQGKPLKSRQDCYWKVRVWDEKDYPTAWSPANRWKMGLLEPSDWAAKWIGDKEPSVTDTSATMLRREFSITGKPGRAIIYASALGVYELRINGSRVGDQLLAPEFTDYHTRTNIRFMMSPRCSGPAGIQ
ncbi:MAG: alpha-L-rhamnosidase N-terminal domain-containing protein [Acidobacteria bacterium]|nr:alpha-L-rhamnosidase N-terminal domain-containing protein [Acidobacteriota bacterium]